MKNLKIGELWFYKYRYYLSYGSLILAFFAIVLYTLTVAPNGLTASEIHTATNSANLSFSNIFSAEILNLPYLFLQNLSISIFGLSNFSIKLPSILLSVVSIFAIIKLSHAWFSKGTATLASILAVASSQFFFVAQNGTPEILYIFYPVVLLLAGFDFLKNKNTISLVILAIILALSLYTPLSIYILIALGLTIFLHPHLRFVISREEKRHKIIGATIFSLAILPLVISIFKNPAIIQTIFGLPGSFNLFENLKILLSNLFGFSSENSTGIISPIISPPILILITIGLFFIFASKHTPKSYLIISWLVILFAVCAVNPTVATILFAPLLILTIFGLQGIFLSWYTIFPKNPYARFLGLIPIVIFVSSLFLVSLNNFRQNYIHSPNIVKNFSQDLKILREKTSGARNLLLDNSEKDFYAILIKKSGGKILEMPSENEFIASKKSLEMFTIPENYKIEKILTSSRKDDADRFYIFKKS